MFAQVLSQGIGAAVEFGVGPRLLTLADCNCLRCSFGMRLEQAMHQLTDRVGALCGIDILQQVLALRSVEQRHLLQHLLVIGHHGLQQTQEVASITTHGAFVEQRRGVLQRADQLPVHLADVQRQVEFCRITGHCDALQGHVAEQQSGVLVVLP